MSRIVGMSTAVQAAVREYHKSGTAQRSSRLFGVVEVLSGAERSPGEVVEALRQEGAPELAAVVERHATRSTLAEFRDWLALVLSLLSLVLALSDQSRMSDAEVDRIVAALIEALGEREAATPESPPEGGGGGVHKAE